MNRVTRGTVFLAAAVAMVSCKGDPTGDLRGGIDHLIAKPGAIFLHPDSSKNVLIEALDKQGNRLAATFTLGNVGAGITVVPDDSFNLVFDTKGHLVPPKNWTRIQYIVSGVANTSNSSFVVTAGGKSITIPVRIVPDSAPGTAVSSATPNVGDTVSLTAPASFLFTPASVVTNGTAVVATLGISADSTTIQFVPGPGATGTVSVSGLVVQYATVVSGYTMTSSNTITTSAAPSLTLNTTNAAAGDTIVVTAPAPYKFTPASTPTVTGAGLSKIGISADSTQLSFLIGPSAAAAVSVNNVVVNGAGGLGTFTLNTGATTLNTPAVSNLAVTFSTTTPNINDNVTLTAPAGIKFLPSAKVFFGNDQQTVTSVAADSNSLVIRAHKSGASGQVSVGNVALSFLTSVPFTSTITATANVGASITPLAGTGAFATAPKIVIPDAGKTGGIIDAGAFSVGPAICSNSLGGPCRIYTFTISSARTFAVSASWQGTTDIGVYFSTAAGAVTGTTGCDAKGAGAGGQPETCTASLAAGTYFLVVDSFAPFYGPPNDVDPTDINVTLTGQ